jgi:uncharacterized protein YkwD
MSTIKHRSRGPCALALLLACGLATGSTASAVTLPPLDPGALLPGGGGASPHAAPRCPAARRRPARMSRARARAALLCSLTRARAAHGLPALHADPALGAAADRQARDMVARHYVDHVRAGGPDLAARLRDAGWRGTAYAEAIAWGCGGRARPRAIVRAWLHSPVHRAIVLSPLLRQAGVGLAQRPPAGGCSGATWVLDAGR